MDRGRQKEIAGLIGTADGGAGIGIGIGIDSGQLSFGEFGRSHRDLTAIGTVVNTAARAQSAHTARVGILISLPEGIPRVTGGLNRSASDWRASAGKEEARRGIMSQADATHGCAFMAS